MVSNDGSFNQSEEGILQIIEPDVIEVLSSPKRSMQSTDSKLRTPSPSGKENNAEKRSPKSVRSVLKMSYVISGYGSMFYDHDQSCRSWTSIVWHLLISTGENSSTTVARMFCVKPAHFVV